MKAPLALLSILLPISLLQAGPKIQQSDGKIIMGVRLCKQVPTLRRIDKNGQWDPTFGVNGVLTLTQEKEDYAVGSGFHQSQSFVIAPDDSIYILMDKRTPDNKSNYQVLHVTKDGAIDTSYGENGRITLGTSLYYNQIAIASDGTVYVSGMGKDTALLTRVNPHKESKLETISYALPEDSMTFGPIGGGSDSIGNVYHFGIGILKLGIDGKADSSFGSEGYTPPPFSLSPNIPYLTTFSDAAFMKDGKVLAVGYFVASQSPGTHPSGVIIRYEKNGKLDRTFGQGGILIIKNYENTHDITQILTIDDLGNIYAGSYHPKRTAKVSIHKYDINGEISTHFGNDGWFLDSIEGNSTTLNRLQIDKEGNLLISTSLSNGGMLFARLLSETGKLDPTFNEGKPVTFTCR